MAIIMNVIRKQSGQEKKSQTVLAGLKSSARFFSIPKSLFLNLANTLPSLPLWWYHDIAAIAGVETSFYRFVDISILFTSFS